MFVDRDKCAAISFQRAERSLDANRRPRYASADAPTWYLSLTLRCCVASLRSWPGCSRCACRLAFAGLAW